jgi:2-amino-4-hydroxy-6-hydroxymethyldihydropteridine diphosphokinase
MSKAFVALGSNLSGNLDCPASQVIRGFQSINNLPKTKLIKQSSLYQSAPVGYDAVQLKAQPDFINAVAEVSTQLSPENLLDALLNIEKEAGRERPFANAPRELDLDVLLYDDLILHSKKLTLPHPRMHERGFVLLPLAEIVPDLVIPNYGNVVKLAKTYKNQGIKKLV